MIIIIINIDFSQATSCFDTEKVMLYNLRFTNPLEIFVYVCMYIYLCIYLSVILAFFLQYCQVEFTVFYFGITKIEKANGGFFFTEHKHSCLEYDTVRDTVNPSYNRT